MNAYVFLIQELFKMHGGGGNTSVLTTGLNGLGFISFLLMSIILLFLVVIVRKGYMNPYFADFFPLLIEYFYCDGVKADGEVL